MGYSKCYRRRLLYSGLKDIICLGLLRLPNEVINVNINWTGATETDPGSWESEPNNGNGQTNTYPGSGVTVRAHANAQGDIDEYKITLTTTANIAY